MHPEFIMWLGERLKTKPGMTTVVLAATGEGGSADEFRPIGDLPEDRKTQCIARAFRYREQVSLYADSEDRGVMILGKGLARRWEIGIEVNPEKRYSGVGTRLARKARKLVPEGEPLFAPVPPGNSASLRAFLRAGYTPIGSEVPFLKSGG